MMATFLDGLEAARMLRAASRPAPGALLVTVQVGEHPAARIRREELRREAGAWGIAFRAEVIASDARPRDVVRRIRALGRDDAVTGIVLLRPVPASLDEQGLVEALPPSRDAEGIHPATRGRALHEHTCPLPAAAGAVLRLLEFAGTPLSDARVVLVAPPDGEIVSALPLLARRGATVTLCRPTAPRLGELTRRADVLVVEAHRPGLIGAAEVREGAVVLDAGVNADPDGHGLVGDVDPEAVRAVASALTPVPGGLGPVATAVLMQNVLGLAARGGRPPDPAPLPLFRN